MKKRYAEILKCIHCGNSLLSAVKSEDADEISEGELCCSQCMKIYPITRGVPRFVDEAHYSGTFGFEWQRHANTQYDSYSGHSISAKRLSRETKWPKEMHGEIILEAGCGGGRFTEQLLKTGATIVSVDASLAVDENFKHHKEEGNSCIVQADITALPFAEGSFDKVLCIGVLQHTPDPFSSLKSLVSMLKSGGSIVVDIYDKSPWNKRIFNTRYWVRPVTKRMPSELLYALVTIYVNIMWPFVKLFHHLPYGTKINHKLLVAEHLSYKKLSPEMQKEWAILDTFDWLSPTYELPQTKETMEKWCKKMPLKNIEITYGYGGIEVRATRR